MFWLKSIFSGSWLDDVFAEISEFSFGFFKTIFSSVICLISLDWISLSSIFFFFSSSEAKKPVKKSRILFSSSTFSGTKSVWSISFGFVFVSIKSKILSSPSILSGINSWSSLDDLSVFDEKSVFSLVLIFSFSSSFKISFCSSSSKRCQRKQ